MIHSWLLLSRSCLDGSLLLGKANPQMQTQCANTKQGRKKRDIPRRTCIVFFHFSCVCTSFFLTHLSVLFSSVHSSYLLFFFKNIFFHSLRNMWRKKTSRSCVCEQQCCGFDSFESFDAWSKKYTKMNRNESVIRD
jgi:hypothetical protein